MPTASNGRQARPTCHAVALSGGSPRGATVPKANGTTAPVRMRRRAGSRAGQRAEEHGHARDAQDQRRDASGRRALAQDRPGHRHGPDRHRVDEQRPPAGVQSKQGTGVARLIEAVTVTPRRLRRRPIERRGMVWVRAWRGGHIDWIGPRSAPSRSSGRVGLDTVAEPRRVPASDARGVAIEVARLRAFHSRLSYRLRAPLAVCGRDDCWCHTHGSGEGIGGYSSLRSSDSSLLYLPYLSRELVGLRLLALPKRSAGRASSPCAFLFLVPLANMEKNVIP